MYADSEQDCFYILLSREFAWSSHPSISLTPPTLPFYLLRLPEADAVISPAFNSLSHPLASPFFKSCLPLPCWMHSLRFPIPAARRSRRCQTWRKRRNQHKGQNDGMIERACEWKTKGCRCNKVVIYSFPSVSKADFIDFSNPKHSHSRTFHRPIDWNWLPWGSLVL